MRSSVLVLLIALVLAFAFAPSTVSADANLTLYQDSSCATPVGEPTNIPFPSSSSCQTVPDQSISFIYYCAPDGGNTNFTFAIFNTTTDCSGTPTVSVTSDDKTGSCASATITFQGQSVPAYAKISCSSSVQSKKMMHKIDAEDANELMEDIMEDIQEQVESAGKRGPVSKLERTNAILKMLNIKQ